MLEITINDWNDLVLIFPFSLSFFWTFLCTQICGCLCVAVLLSSNSHRLCIEPAAAAALLHSYLQQRERKRDFVKRLRSCTPNNNGAKNISPLLVRWKTSRLALFASSSLSAPLLSSLTWLWAGGWVDGWEREWASSAFNIAGENYGLASNWSNRLDSEPQAGDRNCFIRSRDSHFDLNGAAGANFDVAHKDTLICLVVLNFWWRKVESL